MQLGNRLLGGTVGFIWLYMKAKGDTMKFRLCFKASPGVNSKKELQVYFTRQTFALTSSCKFELIRSLCKFPLQAFNLNLQWYLMAFKKPVSQSCAVANSGKFWRASGQSNLANRMEDCSIGQSAWPQLCEYENQTFGSFCCGQPFVYQV